jgi:SAM-dependent methyltransferase
MQDLTQILTSYGGKDLQVRKNWYVPAAAAYNQVRPRYPQALIEQVLGIIKLNHQAKILEVGCGPGTATLSFAPFGYALLALEPNPAFYQLARQNCAPYPNVEILNSSFEEWTVTANQFDAVLAASAFHWIPAAVGYPKAAAALSEHGSLILLWNNILQPCPEVYAYLAEVYQTYAPELDRYQSHETQEVELQALGQMGIDSGYFNNLRSGKLIAEVTYSAEEYLLLLSTYSQYLSLEAQLKQRLFEALREKIELYCGGNIQLSYLSLFHTMTKSSS